MVDFAQLRADGMCACGLPLHYSSPDVQFEVEQFFPNDNQTIVIRTPQARYIAQRHYIALHGLREIDLERLADAGVIERITE